MRMRKPLVPASGAKPVGPYVPGLEVGDYVYVSGQGVSNLEGKRATEIEALTRQAIENVRVILEVAGLGLHDVVSVQFYLLDLKNLAAADRVYHEHFGDPGPARVILGTARMPTDTPVEITVVAARKTTCHITHLVEYSTEPWKPGVVSIDALPDGTSQATFAVAGDDGQTTFCPVVASDPHGNIEEQTRSAFDKLIASLATKQFTLGDITATNVYLNDMDDFARMNAVYAGYFPAAKPSRTTVQPTKTVAGESLVRISAFAVK